MNILEARRRTLGKGVYKKTVEGNPAIAQGSLARRYPGITMQGWTEQDSTTGAQLINPTLEEVTNEGVTIRKNDDGTYRVEGTASDTVVSVKIASVILPAGTYTLTNTGNVGTGGEGWNSRFRALKEDTFGLIGDAVGSPLTQTLEQSGASAIYIQVNKGVTINATLKPMLNKGSTALPYEPYIGGQPSPNPDYPQEIVSAGKYDEGTGKYQYTIKISDSEESPTKSQTVTLTSDRPLTKWDRLEKRNDQWGWVYKSAEIESYTDESVPGEYFSTTGQLSTGAQVWYETTTETFIPLSESEQEQMNALHTFRPTTVLSNDCDCNMTLTYKTKKSMQSAPGGGV